MRNGLASIASCEIELGTLGRFILYHAANLFLSTNYEKCR